MDDQIHIPPARRGFGLGFGARHQVAVYTKGSPKTGTLLLKPQCTEISKWISKPTDCQRITDFIPAEALAPALHNRLLHADTIELVRILPKMLEHMGMEERARLFGAPLSRIASEVWQEMAQTRPQLLDQGFDPKHPRPYFRKLTRPGSDVQVSPQGDDLLFNGVSMEAAAVILPMLFAALAEASRSQAVRAMADALCAAGEDKRFFAPLAEADINRLVITDNRTGQCDDIINNGRTLMIRSVNGPKLRFQGDDFTSSNLHFHPLKNADATPPRNTKKQADAKPEFVRYPSAANDEVVGQLHAIFTAPGKRALLLGADVILGEPNKEIGNYIDFLKAEKENQPLGIDEKVSASGLAFRPLACYTGRFDADGVPEAPFMSLQLGGLKINSPDEVRLKENKSDVFYRGVRVIHLPEPVTISLEQLKALRELQPVLMPVAEDTCVHPIARFQPVRQQRQEMTPRMGDLRAMQR